MSNWQIAGLDISMTNGVLKLEATSGFAKISLGGKVREIELNRITGIALTPPKSATGKLEISDAFLSSKILYKQKEAALAEEFFTELSGAAPQAVGGPLAPKSWTDIGEKTLRDKAVKAGVTLDSISDSSALADATVAQRDASLAAKEALKAAMAENKAEVKAQKQEGKAAAAAAKEKEKAAKIAEKNRLEAEHLNKYGRVVVTEMCGMKKVWLYEKGFVAFGLIKAGVPEKLLDISGNADVTKKSGIGRAAGAAFTMGANLVLSPNKRGDLYLAITTNVRTHMIHMSPPSESDMKAMHKLISAGQAILNQQESKSAQTSTASIDLSEQLTKLSELHKSGILSDAEFQAAKAKLIS